MPYKDHRKKMLSDAKRRSIKHNLQFNISYTDYNLPSVCPILGIPLSVQEGHSNDYSPTLDRIDNNKGYVVGNVWVISQLANQMKSSASLVDLLKFSSWSINHFLGSTLP